MKFSFIIPVYNCGQYLDKFIREIEDVNLSNYEIILVDDGSTDDSGNICDSIAQKNENVYCIHQKNQGVASARNNGLQIARGDYICFFDADDNIIPEKLNKLLGQIENSTTVIDIAVFGMSFDYYHRGKVYRSDLMQPLLQGGDTTEWRQKLVELFYSNSLSSICNKVFRRSFLVEKNLYLRSDMFLYEDLEYSFRCMTDSCNILFEPEVIYHYRQSEDEGNAGRRLMRIEHIYSVVDQIEAAFDRLEEQADQSIEKQINHILISLYLVLAREKIAFSSVKQIRQICGDFADWYHRHNNIEIPVESKVYARLLLEGKIMRILMKRKYTEIRHRIAVGVKNTGVYQRLKG